ncbi:hypothetical protein D3C80_20350 [compost metagenome]
MKYIRTKSHLVAFHRAMEHYGMSAFVLQHAKEPSVSAGFITIGIGEEACAMEFEGKSISMNLNSDPKDGEGIGDNLIALWRNWRNFVLVDEALFQAMQAKGEVGDLLTCVVKRKNGVITNMDELPKQVRCWILAWG